ncbi:hypothetical protein CERSUDRAFT_120159 [Gelatoporia subvermispora B]|uniref:F-box domain-containing protein n=1 Tax=Ceriporiopsis subvermispora (strain B) TaxID=914234 RepID=M2QG82_CERS8|nr:hypothetical protein CERSUDRAFT_120159 [Gelatoporia subvermispora B]
MEGLNQSLVPKRGTEGRSMETGSVESRSMETTASTPLHKSHLSFDLLFFIMELLELQCLSRMMQTCHMLYDAGVRLLLSRERYLDSEEQLSSLCHFVLRDVPRRSSFLRHLTIVEDIGESTVALVIELLSHARSLEELDVESEPDLIKACPDLVDAVCSLPSLRTLGWHVVEQAGIEAIQRMQAPLEAIHVSFGSCVRPQDLAEVLKPFAKTIQQLRANRIIVAPSTVQFSALLYLHLMGSHEPIDTNALMSVFPEVRSFHLESPLAFHSADAGPWVEMRQANERRARLPHRWTIMPEVTGSIISLWNLALDCKVMTLTVRMSEPGEAALLSTLLRDSNPFRLCLTVMLSAKLTISQFIDVLAGATSVKQLDLVIRPNRYVTDSGPQILDGVLTMLELSEIAILDVVINRPGLRLVMTPEDMSLLEYLDQAEDLPFVEELAARVPSLHMATVKLGCKTKSLWKLNPVE